MRFSRSLAALSVALLCIVCPASAQRHDLGSAPPTAPPAKPIAAPQAAPFATPNLGTLQFATMNLAVSAPQELGNATPNV